MTEIEKIREAIEKRMKKNFRGAKKGELATYAYYDEDKEILSLIDSIINGEPKFEPLFNVGDNVLYRGRGYERHYNITKIDSRGYYVKIDEVPNGIIPFNEECLMSLIPLKFNVGEKIWDKKHEFPQQTVEEICQYYYKVRDCYTNAVTCITFRNQDEYELVNTRFEIGDVIKNRKSCIVHTITAIDDKYYHFPLGELAEIEEQDEWELVAKHYNCKYANTIYDSKNRDILCRDCKRICKYNLSLLDKNRKAKFKAGQKIICMENDEVLDIYKIEGGMYVSADGATIDISKQDEWRLVSEYDRELNIAKCWYQDRNSTNAETNVAWCIFGDKVKQPINGKL